MRKNELLKLARAKAGYDLDRASNGMYLPETEAARAQTPASSGLPLHRGSHSEYSRIADELANKELARLVSKYGSADKIPPHELAKSAARLEDNLRDVVKDWKTISGEDKLK